VEGEAVVAVAGLALGPGQRIFLVRFGMQEDREILADRAKPAACMACGVAPTTT
jgi:hypothetical protein